MAFTRRDALKTTAGLLAAASPYLARPAWAQSSTLRLWLQSQWWDPSFTANFEKVSGVRVQQSNSTNVISFSKLQAGNGKDVDVVQMVDSFVRPLAAQKLIQPLDLDQVPNVKALYPQFANMKSVMGDDGKVYGVPFVWGYDALLYNADHVAQTDTWKSLFDDRYKGKIAMRDDPWYGLATGALAMGKKNTFAMSKGELQEVKTWLISKKPMIRTLWTSLSEVVNLTKSQDIWISPGWLPIYWVLARQEKVNVRYPIPVEGAPGFVQTFIIPRESTQAAAAHKFINWMLSDAWAAPIAIDKGYYSTTTLALPKIPEDVRKALGYDQIDKQMSRLIWTTTPSNLQEWTEAWTEFKAA